MNKQFNPNYFGASVLEKKYNENHGPDGKFASGDGSAGVSKAGDSVYVHSSRDTAPKSYQDESHYGDLAQATAKAKELSKKNLRLKFHVVPQSKEMADMTKTSHKVVFHV